MHAVTRSTDYSLQYMVPFHDLDLDDDIGEVHCLNKTAYIYVNGILHVFLNGPV